MTGEEAANLDLVRRYYAAMRHGGTGAELDEFFAPDIVQEEFPNRLLPDGATRDLAALRLAGERGRALMRSQELVLLDAFAGGSRVFAEATWRGTVGNAAGPFAAGTVLSARFAQVFELRGGRIIRLRNYDCIDPW
jgi:ketosteroid isomerase-like protein